VYKRQLVGYADSHFRHEEELMASVACDRRHVEMHIAIHRDFSAQILKLHDAPIYSGDIAHLLRFLTGWLTNHILSIDQAMARQVRSIRAGMSPEEAYSREAKGLGDPATLSLFTAMDSLSRLLASRNDTLLALNHQLEGVVSERSRAQELLAQIIDGDPVATFVLDAEHRITHWNKACALVTQVPASEIVGMTGPWRAFYEHERPVMADLIISGALEDGISSYYAGKYRASQLIPGAFEAEDFFPRFGDGGCWMFFTAAPLKDADGRIIGAIETLQDVTERRNAEQELRNAQASLEELVEKRTQQLAEANRTLEDDIKRREQAEQELLRRYGELTQLNAKPLRFFQKADFGDYREQAFIGAMPDIDDLRPFVGDEQAIEERDLSPDIAQVHDARPFGKQQRIERLAAHGIETLHADIAREIIIGEQTRRRRHACLRTRRANEER